MDKLLVRGLFLVGINIGNIISVLKRRKKIPIQNIKEICINRSDRIGDAIITKPLLILFNQYVKKYNTTTKMHILASTLNYNILNNIQGYTIEIKKEILKEPDGVIKIMIKQILNLFYICFSFGKKQIFSHKIFIDLIGDVDMVKQYHDQGYFCLGPNLYLNNFLLYYALPNSYRGPEIKNLIDYYIDLIEGGIQSDGAFRAYVYDNISSFYEVDVHRNNDGILLFVGNKKFKNLDSSTWKKIIDILSRNFSNKHICVIDDNSNDIYEYLQKEKFDKNVSLLKNTFSLEEFKELALKYGIIIGTDGGGMNFIRNLTHTLIIYPSGPENYLVWSWFVGDKWMKGKKIKQNGITLYMNDEVCGRRFAYIYKNTSTDSYTTYEKELMDLIIEFCKQSIGGN